MFYRICDGDAVEEEDITRLRSIEVSLFGLVKDEVMNTLGQEWNGSLDQQKKIDQSIASKIRTSFSVYERTNKYQKSFFLFK